MEMKTSDIKTRFFKTHGSRLDSTLLCVHTSTRERC